MCHIPLARALYAISHVHTGTPLFKILDPVQAVQRTDHLPLIDFTLVVGFRKIVVYHRWPWIQRLTGYYMHALLLIMLALLTSRHGTATERSENATSSCSTA